MEPVKFKLKQASVVLGVSPKDLQNLVQLGVVRPSRRMQVYWFDFGLLLQAKVAFYLKESLGSSSELLARFTALIAESLAIGKLKELKDIYLRSRPVNGKDAVEIKIPLRSLALDLEKQLPRAAAYRDLPRGRKRPGWKKDFLHSLEIAASEMGDVSEEEIQKEVRVTRAMLARRKQSGSDILGALKQSIDHLRGRRGPSSARKKQPEITLVGKKTKTA
jgi:hypothetical protein